MSMIASSRERKRSVCPLSRRSFGCIVPLRCCRRNHDARFEGTPKTKLQAFEPSHPKSLQSQMLSHPEIRLPLNGLGVLHGRPVKRNDERDAWQPTPGQSSEAATTTVVKM